MCPHSALIAHFTLLASAAETKAHRPRPAEQLSRHCREALLSSKAAADPPKTDRIRQTPSGQDGGPIACITVEQSKTVLAWAPPPSTLQRGGGLTHTSGYHTPLRQPPVKHRQDNAKHAGFTGSQEPH